MEDGSAKSIPRKSVAVFFPQEVSPFLYAGEMRKNEIGVSFCLKMWQRRPLSGITARWLPGNGKYMEEYWKIVIVYSVKAYEQLKMKVFQEKRH